MSEFTFEGMRVTLEPEWVIAHSARLTEFRERLRAGGVDEFRAQQLLERLVIGAFATFGEDYLAQMGRQLDAIMRIRGELRSRFEMIIRRPPGAAVDPRLSPSELGRLEGELEQHLETVNGRSPTRAADGATPLTDEQFRRIYAGEEPSELHPGQTAETQGEGTPLDDPYARSGAPGVRARAETRARILEALLNRGGGGAEAPAGAPRWTVELQRARNAAQARGLAALDPDFAANGFELKITAPDGTVFEPDGVRLIGDPANPAHFEVLEWKGLTDNPFAPAYIDIPSGFESLLLDIANDVRRAQQLAPLGCTGFVWATDSVKMFGAFESASALQYTRGVTFLGPQ